jgi:hypothetical protein
MGIRKAIRNWLVGDMQDARDDRPVMVSANVLRESPEAGAKVRFSLVEAMNGRLVEVSTYKPNPHGPDWTTQLYIMREDESVGDAINTLMVLKGN